MFWCVCHIGVLQSKFSVLSNTELEAVKEPVNHYVCDCCAKSKKVLA